MRKIPIGTYQELILGMWLRECSPVTSEALASFPSNIPKKGRRLEGGLVIMNVILLWHRTQAQFPITTSVGLQLSVTPAPGDLLPSAGLRRHLHTHTYKYIIKLVGADKFQ